MKTKKLSIIFVAMLMCLTFVLALIPLTKTTVLATGNEDTHIHCVCGKKECSDNHGEEITFDMELTSQGGDLETGNYYLSGDVTLTTNICISSGNTVNICLNGHVLKGKGNGSVITNCGTLNICDCDSSTSHKFVPNEDDLWVWNESATGDNVKTINGGVITGGSGLLNGGGICNGDFGDSNGGTLNMYNGTIAGNQTPEGRGGGVYNNNLSTFNMYNGTIAGNKVGGSNSGGGIYNSGNITMFGGKISENKAYSGGGVCNRDGSFTMNGGNITGNKADMTNQSGIVNSAKLSISGSVKVDDILLGSPAVITITDALTCEDKSIRLSYNIPFSPPPYTVVVGEGYELRKEDLAKFVSASEQYVVEFGKDSDADKFVYNKLHEHSWYIVTSENKIYVCCEVINNCCEYYREGRNPALEDMPIVLTLNAPDAEYTGNAYNSASIDATAWTSVGETAPTIEYYDKNDTKLTGAPTAIGSYVAKFTLEGKTASKSFNITRTNITEFTAPQAKTLTYNGSKQAVLTAGTTTVGSFKYKVGENGTWGTTVPEIKNAGDYTIYWKIVGNENYNDYDGGSISVTIAKKSVKVTGINFEEKVYDGTKNANLKYDNVQFEGKEEADVLTVTATGTYEYAGANSENSISITNIQLGGKDEDNYQIDNNGSQKVINNGRILSKSLTESMVTAIQDQVYTGVEIRPLVNISDGSLLTEEDYELTFSNNVNFGRANVRIVGKNNYTGELNLTFNITKQKVAKPVPTTTQFTYDGTTHVLGLIEDERYVIKGVTSSKNAGSCRAFVNLVDADKYEWEDGTTNEIDIVWSIVGAKLTITAEDCSKTYGEKDGKLSYTATGLVNGDTIEVNLSREEGENAGTYIITASASHDNYDISFVAGKFTILSKSIKDLTIVVELGDALQYNGQEQTQEVKKVKIAGEEVGFDVSGNKATTAGVHTMKITVKGNYVGTFDQKYIVLEKESKTDEFIEVKTDDGKSDIKVDDGNIIVEVVTDDSQLDASLVSEGKDLMDVLDANELAKVAGGDNARIWVDMKDASDTISDIAKEQIANKLKEEGKFNMGAYIDISLFKKLESEAEATQIHHLDKKIKVSIVVPENLRKTARTFCIVRNHDGVVDIIDGEYDEATYTFTFETDKFSDYGIAYKDYCVICKDRAPLFLGLCWLAWLIILLVLIALLIGTFFLGRYIASKKKDRVSNSDTITVATVENVATEESAETMAIVTPVVEETEVETEEETDEPDEECDDEEIVDTTEVGGSFARYNKSFTAKLIQANAEIQGFYGALKNHLLGYQKVLSRMSWANDTFHSGRTTICKFAMRGKSLFIYLPLNEEEATATNITKVSETKRYESVKSFTKIKGSVSLKRAIKAIDLVCARLGLAFTADQTVDYGMPFETTEALIEKGLIKLVKQRTKAVSIADARASMEDHVALMQVDTQVRYSTGKNKAIINIDTISENYQNGETVTVENLREKGLIAKKCDYVKVLARGTLDKSLTVIADEFSIDAVKMILLAGGSVIKLVKKED